MAKTQETYTRSIGAKDGGFQPTGIIVEAGDTITFSNATGTMQPWGGAPVYTPAGHASLKWGLSLVPSETFCKLVGSIRGLGIATQVFGIGTGGNVVATISGEILLGINDGVDWGDNQGPGYSVQISLPQESFLAIPPEPPLAVGKPFSFHMVRDYATHQIEQPDLLGVDYVITPDVMTFDTQNYTDPLSRTGTKFLERRVTSMTDGIIINCFHDGPTTGDAGNEDPRFPGENQGITIEVLTWHPYTSTTPDTYYVIQYTHVFPTFGTWNSLNFPSIQTQINNGTILSTRENQYENLTTVRNSNAAFGPFISQGDELGGYAMIGLSSVGPHLHISIAKYDATNGTMPTVGSGRPQFGNQSDFFTWLTDPFGATQFDPELFVPGAALG